MSNLRARLPGKAGTVLSCIDDVELAWDEHDHAMFPFNVLRDELDALKGTIQTEYGNPDSEVDRKSLVYDSIIRLEHRLNMSSEFLISSRIFEDMERRFRRIDEVLPARNYALRDLVSGLQAERVGPDTRRRLEAAVRLFEDGKYKDALRECGEAGEALFDQYKQMLIRHGCVGMPNNVGPALNHVRKWLADENNRDTQEHRFAPRSRVEWFLLSMFETLHYLRNVVMHPRESDERVPSWQARRRASFVDGPEHARLGLCLGVQIAVELQTILAQEGSQA